MRFRLIFSILGSMTVIGGLMMVIPALVDWFYGDNDSASIFALSSVLTIAGGGIILLLTDTRHVPLRTKEMFVTTTLIWFSFVLFSAFPLYFLKIDLTFIDALFEAASGYTTTGATVIPDLDKVSRGTLLWRSLMHWMGGIGILVVAILILPTLQIGGMQLFNIEASGESSKDIPTAAKNIMGICYCFVSLTVMAAFSLWLAGMDVFDSINHAMSAISTGGFSTHNESIAYYNSPAIEWILSFFMFIAGMPLMLGILLFRRHFEAIKNNEQIKWFCWFVFSVVLFLISIRWYQSSFNNAQLSGIIRTTIFDVVSIVTSTGFVVDNYTTWGSYAPVVFLMLMVVGGCTGSTSGGIKVFRFAILIKTIRSKLKSAARPQGVFIPRYGNKPVTDEVMSGVFVLMGLYSLSVIVGVLLLSLYNLDLVTILSGVITTLSNIGPGLGNVIGPDQTFSLLPQGVKLIMTFLMILGRLEFVAVYILMVPFFWKKNI